MSITSHFYHGSTRKIIVAFGTLFNNITVVRNAGKIITVPLTYASKEVFFLTLKQNASMNKMNSMTLPRMGFIITNIGYDFERKQSSIAKFSSESVDSLHRQKMFMPVPYNINIQLSIYSRNMNDGLQIIEQILPFFKPSFNITINELSDMSVMRDIPIILDTITHEDNSEMNVGDSVRLLRWDLDFTIKANFYGPVKNQSVIKHVYVDYHTSKDGVYQEKIDEQYKVSVDPEDAQFDDVWVYNEEILSIEDNPIMTPTEDITASLPVIPPVVP